MLKAYLTSLLNSVNGCSAILVYDVDKDSTPIFRVGELSDADTNAIKQNIGVFNSSIERAEKLCKSRTSSKTVMAFYNHHQLFVFSKGTIVFIVVATSEANTGMILNLKSYLDPLVDELVQSNSLSDATAFGTNSASGTST